MAVLSNLKPESVFGFFEQLTRIPHGSGDTGRVSDYVEGFAIEKNLSYHRDDMGNIVIWAPASKGYEDEPSLMLQGHLDMVCDKTDDCDIDIKKDGLNIMIEGDVITAKGTTLGGDDGIAVAYMMAVLEDESILHPPLECVFTVDEEIGLLGASGLDKSILKSKLLINLDSEEEGYLLTSCAGGATADFTIPISRKDDPRMRMILTVSGLKGGHSGSGIDRGRAAANELLGRVLSTLSEETSFSIVSVDGGRKENAIARSSRAVIAMYEGDMKKAEALTAEMDKKLKAEYAVNDPGLTVELSQGDDTGGMAAMDAPSTARIIAALRLMPQGIQRMSPHIAGLVETSLNLGILKTKENAVEAEFCTRSSLKSGLDEIHDRLYRLAGLIGGTLEISGEYPAMEYRENSPLRDRMTEVYKRMYGEEMKVYAIHAGVECGLFAEGIEDLDAVSIGPDMSDVHTPQETLSISSVKRTWEYLKEVLKTKVQKTNSI